MYRLKRNLSKSRIRKLIEKFLPAGIQMSRMSECYFRRHRGAYWLTWHKYEASFLVFAGKARLHIKEMVWPEEGEVTWIDHGVVMVPFEYLRDNGFLEEK